MNDRDPDPDSDPEARGLGRVVYSTDEDAGVRRPLGDTDGDGDLVQEGSEESFPGSDPPGYATGTADTTTADDGGEGDGDGDGDGDGE